mgnify:CR=1 FL=1
MDPSTLLQHATPSLSLALLLAFLSVVGGLTLGALLLGRRAVHPLLSGLALGPLALGITALVLWAGLSGDPADVDASRTAVAAPVVLLLVVPFFALLPALFHGGLALAGALREGPRQVVPVVISALPALVAVVAPIVGGLVVGNGFFEVSLLRVVPYALLALLVVPAMAGGGEQAGPTSSASAGLAFVTLVGLGEASLRGVFAFLMLGRFATLPDAPAREALVLNARATLLAPTVAWSWVAFVAAAVVAVVGIVVASRREGGASSAAGAVWILLAAVPMVLADVPTSAWSALAQALGSS